MSVKQKRWVVKPSVSEEVRAAFPEIKPVVMQLLNDRGLTTQKDIDQFLNPDYEGDIHDPFLFSQMQAAVDRLLLARENNEKITVHGDYDADGVSGSVILVSTLKHLGFSDVTSYLPHRDKEGYGLNMKTVDYLAGEGTKVIITTDCGISNVEEIAYARSKGIDVIITDHHTQKDTLPDAIILHPKVKGESYPFKDLAGGGVAFKLAQGLLRHESKIKPEMHNDFVAFEKWLLDMVAVSSVADMVPLIGENRTLVKYGLIVLGKTKRIGMQALLKESGRWQRAKVGQIEFSTYDIGFIIGPRINAAGRIDHSNIAFKLLMSDNEADAIRLAIQLEETNKERQEITTRMVAEGVQQVGMVEPGAQALVVYDPNWSMGVVGLVAGRLLEKFHLPVFACAQIDGKIAGSGRSIEGYDCTEALDSVKDLLLKYGGHPRACGFTMNDNTKFEELKRRFSDFAKNSLTAADLIPKLEIDAEISISDITWDFHEQIQLFEPFGMGNPQPKFLTRNAKIVDSSAIGADQKHLRLVVTGDGQVLRKCIAFGMGEYIHQLKVGSTVDIVYNVDVNEWNGNRELQLKIVDLKPGA